MRTKNKHEGKKGGRLRSCCLHFPRPWEAANGAPSPELLGGRAVPILSAVREYTAWMKVRFLLPLWKNASKVVLSLQALLKCRLPLWDGWLQGLSAPAWEIPIQLLELAIIYHVFTTYCVPNSVLMTLNMLSHFIFITILQDYFYFPYHTDEETKAQKDWVNCLKSHNNKWQ